MQVINNVSKGLGATIYTVYDITGRKIDIVGIDAVIDLIRGVNP